MKKAPVNCCKLRRRAERERWATKKARDSNLYAVMTTPSALDKKKGTVSEIHDTTKILIRKSRNLKSSLTPKVLNPSWYVSSSIVLKRKQLSICLHYVLIAIDCEFRMRGENLLFARWVSCNYDETLMQDILIRNVTARQGHLVYYDSLAVQDASFKRKLIKPMRTWIDSVYMLYLLLVRKLGPGESGCHYHYGLWSKPG